MFVDDMNKRAVYHFDLNENRSALTLQGALEDTVVDTPQESSAAVFGTSFGGITDIKTGPDGDLYVLSFIEASVYTIVPAGASEGSKSSWR